MSSFRYLITALAISIVLSSCSFMDVIPKIAPTVDTEENINSRFDFDSKFVNVLGDKMHYIDEGEGDTVVMLHGNPTSSYLWRNIIPKISKTHRVIALDLIGMGKSDKPNIAYTLQDHIRYFSAFMEELDLKNVTLVVHDWGGGIGLTYARENASNVKKIAIMEAVLRLMYWKEADLVTRYIFKNFRDQKKGDELIINQNYFVEKLLPMMAGRDLSEEEMSYYRAPYKTLESRRPVRVWPQEIPIDETPKRNQLTIGANYEFLKRSHIPLLFMYGEPGMIFTENFVEGLKKDFPEAKFESVGPGLHYLQESQPTKISQILIDWLN